MSAQLLLAPSVVFQIPPPYERYEAVPDLSVLTPQDLPDAALLAIGLDPPRHAWGEAAALVPQLRARSCGWLLYTYPSPRDMPRSRMASWA
jgi:hypothetical protein